VDFEARGHMACSCQILEKKWKYKEAVHQPVLDFKKAYDSVRREVYIIFALSFSPRENGRTN